MLETVAIIGPARFGVPLTQAITAPMLGRLEARGASFLVQGLACGVIRLLHNAATSAFFIWVITGGLDAYAGTYETVGGLVGADVGPEGALAFTAAGLLGWAVFATAVQVWVYRRGLRGWEQREAAVEAPPEPIDPATGSAHRPRADPRLLALGAAAAFVALLSGTSWPLLGALTASLALAWLLTGSERGVVPTGAVLAAILALGAFTFAAVGGLGIEVALRRALRAALLVLVATWLRAAAGAAGLRELSHALLARFGRVPAMAEAARTLDALGSERGLTAAARSVADTLGASRKSPVALVDSMLDWVAREVRRPAAPTAPGRR